jgi:hypothetical protein
MTTADPAQRPTAISPSTGTVVLREGIVALLESSPALGAAPLVSVKLWAAPRGDQEATAADYAGSL